MSAKILDGKKLAAEIRVELIKEISELERRKIVPGLAVILVGSDPASRVYVSSKKKACEEIGVNSKIFELVEEITQGELENLIQRLNKDENIHGILVQLPLPKHLDTERVLETIDPQKDVDCFHPENVGKMTIGICGLLPCTPAGIIEMLKRNNIELSGKNCIVVGRSNIVGKPMALMLLNENATVTICHSKTVDLSLFTKNADILVAAAGKPGLISKDMVKKGVVVVDVGMNRLSNGKLAGDVDFESVKKIASAITPVPGGVGPMTIAMLMKNTVEAAKTLANKKN